MSVEVPEGYIVQAYRYALDPTPNEERLLWSNAGGKRFAYNWMLNHVNQQVTTRKALFRIAELCGWDTEEESIVEAVRGSSPVDWTMFSLIKSWNKAKHKVAPWWAANSKETYASAATDLSVALKNFFDSKNGKRKGERVGWPNRKRKASKQSFTYTGNSLGLSDNSHVKLPRIGRVKLHESARKLGRHLDKGTARVFRQTVSYSGRRWYVSVQVVVERQVGKEARPVHTRQEPVTVGVDWGCGDHLAIVATSDGRFVKISNPRAYRSAQEKLGKLQRHQARCTPGSRQYRRLQVQITKLHARIANIRKEAVNRTTHWLTTTFDCVVTEDLNASGMVKRPASKSDGQGGFLPNVAAAKSGLAKSILDAAPGMMRRQLEYKSEWYGAQLIVYPRFEKSTGVCDCGTKTTLTLTERQWTCSTCGTEYDRDVQAAVTLAKYGEEQNEVIVAGSGSETQNARVRPLIGPREPRKHPRVCNTGTASLQSKAA